MCFKQLDIYNKSLKFSYRGFSLLNSVPCGKCPDCMKRKSQDYNVRTYYEWLSCVSSGGFAYFDTLTYNNKYLPRHYGINHFSKAHLQTFIKKMRVYLSRRGFRTDFKYFISSEYGGLKHRPHYHILIFNYDPNLSVSRLWWFIHRAWVYGFTDVRSKASQRVLNSQAALAYVAKYIHKDQEWQKVVDARIEKLGRLGRVDVILDNIDDYKPFHLQSNGLGKDVLNFVPIQDIFEKGLLYLPDAHYLVKGYAIPTYILRKLFYYLESRVVKDCDGNDVKKYSWHLTELGKQFKKAQLEKVIDSKVDSYKRILSNLPQYHCQNYDVDCVRSLIDSYLDGRSLRDFAIYVLVFRNKTLGLNDPCPDYKSFFDFCLNVPKEKDSHLYDDDFSIRSSARSFLNRFKIDQYSFIKFRNFDDLYNLFNVVKSMFFKKVADSEIEQQKVFDRLKKFL